jgi:hypothetical protein
MSIQQFEFSKTWRDKSAFPTYQTSETQVREDLQCLHDEMADYVNNTLVPAINSGSGDGSSVSVSASDVSFTRSAGVPADNVQDAIENVQSQLAGISQGAVADGSITTDKLADGAVTPEKLASGGIGWRKLTPEEFGFTTEDVTTKTVEAVEAYYCAALGLVRFQAKITVVERTASAAIYDLYFDSTKYYKPTPGDDFYLNGVVNAKCYAQQTIGNLEGQYAVRAQVFGDVVEDSLVSFSGFYYTEDIPTVTEGA